MTITCKVCQTRLTTNANNICTMCELETAIVTGGKPPQNMPFPINNPTEKDFFPMLTEKLITPTEKDRREFHAARNAQAPVSLIPQTKALQDQEKAYKEAAARRDTDIPMSSRYPKYYKAIPEGMRDLDIYGVCKIFDVIDPSGALHHAIKKLLLPGIRTGGKSRFDDIKEARDTLNRWLEIHKE